MRKTILFLTLLLLAGCGKKEPSETKMPPSRADNDSPIIISDTPTLPGTKDRTNGTMVEHVAPSGFPEGATCSTIVPFVRSFVPGRVGVSLMMMGESLSARLGGILVSDGSFFPQPARRSRVRNKIVFCIEFSY